jgi:CHAT domain-containing protein
VTTALLAGARAVVASPWPLETMVASRWTKAFFKSWQTGVGVARAVFLANREISSTHQSPSSFLAMHVYGNPFEKFEQSASDAADVSEEDG